MRNDELLMNQLRSKDQVFRKWAELHHELEDRLEGLNRLKFLTVQEELQKKELQKRKLRKTYTQWLEPIPMNWIKFRFSTLPVCA